MNKEETKNKSLDDALEQISYKLSLENPYLKNEIIYDVVEQIISDVRTKDVEAIEELLHLIYCHNNVKYLVRYLEEEQSLKYKDLL